MESFLLQLKKGTPSLVWVRLILVLLMTAGFALRLVPALSSPVIYDEYMWMRVVDQMSLDPHTLNIPLHGDQHPPGQVYWAYPGTVIFGQNLVGYRSASVLLGTGAILLAFALGRTIAGASGGLVAAFLIAFNEYLIGISRLCTEKNYLVLALLSLFLVWRAIEKPSISRVTLLGAAIGLAVLTKESAALWVPPIAILLILKAGGWGLLRRPAVWWGLLAMFVAVAPALVWSLGAKVDPADSSSLGVVHHLSRLDIGSWSWRPLSLYIRPLLFYHSEGISWGIGISEYASMTTLPGLIVLVGAITSLFILKGWWPRFLQMLGFGTFMFFALFSHPLGEFWWADLSLLPFLLLTAGVIARTPRRGWVVYVLLLAVMLPPALRVAQTRDNCFLPDWGSPAPIMVQKYQDSLTFEFLRFCERDHLTLYRFGSWELPPLDSYRHGLVAYKDYLEGRSTGNTEREEIIRRLRDVQLSQLATERRCVEAEIARLQRYPATGGLR